MILTLFLFLVALGIVAALILAATRNLKIEVLPKWWQAQELADHLAESRDGERQALIVIERQTEEICELRSANSALKHEVAQLQIEIGRLKWIAKIRLADAGKEAA